MAKFPGVENFVVTSEAFCGKQIEAMAHHPAHLLPTALKPEQELKQGRNLEAGAYTKAMEESCLLACSS